MASTSTFDRLLAAVGSSFAGDLDGLAKSVWSIHGAGGLTDDEATALAHAIHQQRRQPGLGRIGDAGKRVAHRVRPVMEQYIRRRRSWLASGWLPPQVQARFTPGQAAVMAVIARECFEKGRCALPNVAIATIAGVCVAIVKRAKAEAVRLGIIMLIERPVAGDRHLPSIVKVVSRELSRWLAFRSKRGGATRRATFPSRPDLGADQLAVSAPSGAVASDKSDLSWSDASSRLVRRL